MWSSFCATFICMVRAAILNSDYADTAAPRALSVTRSISCGCHSMTWAGFDLRPPEMWSSLRAAVICVVRAVLLNSDYADTAAPRALSVTRSTSYSIWVCDPMTSGHGSIFALQRCGRLFVRRSSAWFVRHYLTVTTPTPQHVALYLSHDPSHVAVIR